MADNEKVVITLETKITGLEEQLKATTNIREYNRLLREARGLLLEAGDDNVEAFNRINNVIGQSNDKIGDLNESIRLLSGNPVENVTNSFQGMGTAIRNLDFGGATNSARAFNTSLQNFKIKDLANEFKTFLVTLGSLGKIQTANTAATRSATTAATQDAAARTAEAAATRGLTVATEGATVATNTFSAALKGTGILLLVGAVVALIANFDKLKQSGGAIGAIFTAIGNTIGALIQGMKDLTDFLMLTNFKQKEQEEQDKKINDILKERSKILDENTKKQLEALGASTQWMDLIISQKELNQLSEQRLNLEKSLTKEIDDQIEAQKELLKNPYVTPGYNPQITPISDQEIEGRKKLVQENLKKLETERQSILNNEELLKLENQILIKNGDITALKTRMASEEEAVNQKNSIALNKIYVQTIKNAYDATDRKIQLAKQEETLNLEITKRRLSDQKFLLVQELEAYQILKDRLGLLYELPPQYKNIQDQIGKIIDQEKQADAESAARQAALNKERRDNRIKAQQDAANAEIENYKRVFSMIEGDRSMSIENRKIAEKALLNDQIAFIEKNIDKLFPKDPNKSKSQAAEEQIGKARAAVSELQNKLVSIDEDTIKRQKDAADSRLASEAKIMALRATSLEGIHASEIANLEAKYASETKIVDYKNMTQDEITAHERSEEARKLQFEKDLHDLKRKQQQELDTRRLEAFEREVKYAESQARTGGAFSLGKQLNAIDKREEKTLSELGVETSNKIKIQEDYMNKDLAIQKSLLEKGEILKEESEKRVRDIKEKFEGEKTRITQESEQAQVEIAKEASLARIAAIKQTVDTGVDFARAGAGLMGAITDLQNNKEKASLKEGQKLSAKAQENQFKRGQRLAIVNAIIDTASATVQAYAKMPDPISASIYAAFIAATGAVQIAAIRAQKFVPESDSTSGGGGGGTAPTPAQTNISTPTLFGLGQFDPSTVMGNKPQRVYVLESDITRAQTNVKQVQVAANF